MGATMLSKVVEDARDWNLIDSMYANVLTIEDNVNLLQELSSYFAGDSDFDEEVFNLLEKWTKKYIEEND